MAMVRAIWQIPSQKLPTGYVDYETEEESRLQLLSEALGVAVPAVVSMPVQQLHTFLIHLASSVLPGKSSSPRWEGQQNVLTRSLWNKVSVSLVQAACETGIHDVHMEDRVICLPSLDFKRKMMQKSAEVQTFLQEEGSAGQVLFAELYKQVMEEFGESSPEWNPEDADDAQYLLEEFWG